MADPLIKAQLPDLRTFAPSVVRSLVPLVVSYFGAWPVAQLLRLDDDRVTSLVTVLLYGAYYVVVRLLETYVLPQAGWLLGYASAPVYVPPADSGVTGTPADDVVKVVREAGRQ